MKGEDPNLLILAGVGCVLIWRVLSVWWISHRAARRWTIMAAKKWVLVLLLFDLTVCMMCFFGIRFLGGHVPAADNLPLQVVIAGIGSAGTRRIIPTVKWFRRRSAQTDDTSSSDDGADADPLGRDSFGRYICTMIKQDCYDASAAWLDRVAVPAVSEDRSDRFLESVKHYLAHRQASTAVRDAEYIEKLRKSSKDSYEDKVLAACNRMLNRNGRKRLMSMVSEQDRSGRD